MKQRRFYMWKEKGREKKRGRKRRRKGEKWGEQTRETHDIAAIAEKLRKKDWK